MDLYQEVEISYDFSLSKSVHHFVAKHKVIITKNDFNELPKMTCLIQPARFDLFQTDILAATQSKAIINLTNEFSYINSNTAK